jgi:hypothetical protein
LSFNLIVNANRSVEFGADPVVLGQRRNFQRRGLSHQLRHSPQHAFHVRLDLLRSGRRSGQHRFQPEILGGLRQRSGCGHRVLCQDVLALADRQNKTPVPRRLSGPRDRRISRCRVIYLEGDCRVTDTDFKAQVDDVLQFDVTLTGEGELQTAPCMNVPVEVVIAGQPVALKFAIPAVRFWLKKIQSQSILVEETSIADERLGGDLRGPSELLPRSGPGAQSDVRRRDGLGGGGQKTSRGCKGRWTLSMIPFTSKQVVETLSTEEKKRLTGTKSKKPRTGSSG